MSDAAEEKKRIFLDANFLMMPAQHRVDIFSELERICSFPYELVVVRPVVRELEGLARGNGKAAAEAQLALSLMKAKDVRILEEEPPESKSIKNADDFILQVVRRDRDLVATQDKQLRRALREKGIPRIVLRKCAVLEIRW